MIDLHCHLLPGLDDGPSSIDESRALARVAVAAGTRTIACTPHVRDDFPFDTGELEGRVDELRADFEHESIAVELVAGGEVAVPKAMELPDDELRRLCLGSGSYLLVESPYTEAPGMLDDALFGLQVRGFQVMLAHPERSPAFLTDIDRLARLVDRGIRCSVTAGSMAGRFGRTIQRFCVEMLAEGLVHDVASDAHDARKRPPGLGAAFDALERRVPGLVDAASWLTSEAPSTVLAGGALPARRPIGRGRGWRVRLRRRSAPTASGM